MYIVFEGCIGSGKTTLAKFLAKKCRGKVLLEATRKHPFIRDFYLDPQKYAFQTEMNFILIHYHQLQKAKQLGWFNEVVFSDFLFDKDLLFAFLTLKNSSEFKLFKNTYTYLRAKTTKPNLVFYLKASTEFLYKRIKKRGRKFEKDISFEYLDGLNKEYQNFFKNFPRDKKIIINISNLDWQMDKSISRERVISRLSNLIKRRYALKF